MNMLARICVLLLGILLSACGGGGGDAGTQAVGGSTQALFTSAPASVSVDVARAAEFTISGGKAPYAVSSSDLSVVSTGLQGGSTFLINGVKGGTATVTVKDSLGAAVSIAVTVGPGTPLFTTAPSQMTVAVGAAESFNIGGGSGPFSVSSANSTTATVQLNALGSTFTVTGQRSGTTSVVVTDAKGATVSIGVTVGTGQGNVPLFTSAASPVVIGVGTTPVYTIGGGTGPYQVTSSNESVAKASVVGASVGISGLAAGTASVQVTDAVGGRVSVSVTVGSADVVALYTTAPPGLSLVRGTSQSFSIGGGVGPYTVSSGNVAVVSATLTGSTLSLAGLGVGTATVAVFDSQGRSTPIAVTVGAAAPLSTTALAAITVGPASTQSYTVGGGVAPYTATSNNTAVATATVSGGVLTVNGVMSGSATVAVRDSVGVSVPINVTVSSAAPSPLTISPGSVSGTVGETLTIAMFGGEPPYAVTLSNASVAALTTQSANKFVLSLLKAGTTPVIVSDARGQVQVVSVTSAPPAALPLTLSVPSSVAIPLGSSRTVSISGGVAPYLVGSSNEAVMTAAVAGSVLTLTPQSSGTASVAVTDAVGSSISLNATIGSAVNLFTTAPASLSIGQGTSQTFSVLGGRAPYFVSSSNPVTLSASVVGSVLTITGGAPGSGAVAVRDSVGASVAIAVTVGNQTPLFTSAPANVVMSAGTQRSFLVDGGSPSFAAGVPVYQVASSDPTVATATLSGNALTLTSLSGGTSQIAVTDSLGARINFQVTVGGAVALHTTAPSAITVSPGALNAQTYEIRGGASPYSVTSGNVAVATVSQAANLYTVTGLGVGAANVQITDRLGATLSVAVTVASGAAAPLSVSPLAATGTVGDVIRFEIRGGTPVYTATVANQNVASAAAFGSGTTAFTVQLNAIGSSNIAVIDSLGQVQNVSVTAQNVNLTPLFTSAPASVGLAVGTPQTFTVGGGSGTYLFASSDPAVVSVPAASSTQLVLTPVGIGSATVNVTDSAGARTSFSVVVGGVQPLRLSPGTAVTLGLTAGATTYAIAGGRTPYTAVSTNAGVVSVSPPGATSSLILSPVAAGTANVVVTDAAGTQVSLAVTVAQSGVQTMTVSPASASANVGDTLVFAVSGGTSPYAFTVNNSAVATLTSTSPGPSPGRLRMDNAGSTTVTVTDATGQVQTVTLTVTQSATQLRLSPTTLILPETYQLGVDAATTNLLLNIYGGSGGFTAYTTDPVRAAVSVVNGSQIRISRGSSGTLCSNTDVTRYALSSVAVTDASQPAATNAFDIVVTVVDNKGASATAKLVVIDDGLNLNPTTTCR
jgi:hypothetical protein